MTTQGEPLTRERSNSRVNDFLAGDEPLYFLNQFYEGASDFLDSYDPSKLPTLNDRPLEECREDIITAFMSMDPAKWREFVTSQPEILRQLRSAIRTSIPTHAFREFLACWPVSCPSDPTIKNLLIFLAHLVREQEPDDAACILWWVATSLAPDNWHRSASIRSSIIKCACQVTIPKRGGDFWLLLDMNNRFYVQTPSGDDFATVMCGKVSGVQVEGKHVKLFDRDGELVLKFTPKEQSQLAIWKAVLTKDPIPFPMRLTSNMDGQIPSQLLPALYEILTADDMLVLRALTHYSVVKVAEGVPLQFALVDIFSYAGKMNQFLLSMVGNEFNGESLLQTSVLRGNSHLTCLFKVWNERFGKDYVSNVIQKMIEFVDSFGDVHIDNPEECDEHAAKKILLTCLRAVLNSQEHVSLEMRHLASVLKSVSGCRFNTKQAAFNTLSGYFFLRFVTALFTCPEGFDKTMKLNDDLTKGLTAFSPVLQVAFNLISYGGKYNRFSSWNAYVKKRIFPSLVNFAFSIAEIDEVPEYPAPPVERLEKSLKTVFHFMSGSHEKFCKRYHELLEENADIVQPVGWNICAFLQSLFKNNIAD